MTEPPSVPQEPPIRVMAIHALAYCERLFYLEEIEEIREADDRVYAGRKLHEERCRAVVKSLKHSMREFFLTLFFWGLFRFCFLGTGFTICWSLFCR